MPEHRKPTDDLNEGSAYDRSSAPHDLADQAEEFKDRVIYERPEPTAMPPGDRKLANEPHTVHRMHSPRSDYEDSADTGDDIVLERINERLTWSQQIESGGIRLKVDQGVVTLHGHVDSAEDRQAAEDEVRAISGVREVVNQLEVQQAS